MIAKELQNLLIQCGKELREEKIEIDPISGLKFKKFIGLNKFDHDFGPEENEEFSHLKNFITKLPPEEILTIEHLPNLIRFLENRWQRIKSTFDKDGYFCIRTRLDRFCVEIAKIIATIYSFKESKAIKTLPVNFYYFLMPTLTNSNDYPATEKFRKQLTISDDGTRLISIYDVLEKVTLHFENKLIDDSTLKIALTASEISLLRRFYWNTNDPYASQKMLQKKTLKEKSTSLEVKKEPTINRKIPLQFFIESNHCETLINAIHKTETDLKKASTINSLKIDIFLNHLTQLNLELISLKKPEDVHAFLLFLQAEANTIKKDNDGINKFYGGIALFKSMRKTKTCKTLLTIYKNVLDQIETQFHIQELAPTSSLTKRIEQLLLIPQSSSTKPVLT